MLYYVHLQRGDEDLRCRMSPVLVRLWQQLKVGEQYKISVNWTRGNRCFIYEATPIEE